MKVRRSFCTNCLRYAMEYNRSLTNNKRLQRIFTSSAAVLPTIPKESPHPGSS